MTGQPQNRRNAANNGAQIPQRVENAAQSMINQASFGPRRGYIPSQDTGRTIPPQGGWH